MQAQIFLRNFCSELVWVTRNTSSPSINVKIFHSTLVRVKEMVLSQSQRITVVFLSIDRLRNGLYLGESLVVKNRKWVCWEYENQDVWEIDL